jgi:hypothetical protein
MKIRILLLFCITEVDDKGMIKLYIKCWLHMRSDSWDILIIEDLDNLDAAMYCGYRNIWVGKGNGPLTENF